MSEKSQMSNLGCAFLIITIVVQTFLNGVVAKYLWLWFVVPTLNTPPLSLPAAMGISLLVGFLTSHLVNRGKTTDPDVLFVFFYSLFQPLFTLGIGWLIALFM